MLESYKRFLLFIPIVSVVLYAFIFMVVNIVIDPYREYGLTDTKKYFQSYYTVPFKMYQKLRHDKYVLVFGTSHSATISAELLNHKTLNMSTSVYGNPVDDYYFLKNLDRPQISNIEKIYYLIDYNVFEDKKSDYPDINFNSKIDFFYQTANNLNKKKILRAVDNILKYLLRNNTTEITDNGEFVYVRPVAYRNIVYKDRIKFSFSGQSIEHLEKIDKFCKSQNIEIIYFKSIFSRYFLQNVDFESVESQLSRVLNIIDEMYCLMYVEGVSDNMDNFRNPTHHIHKIAKIEIDILRSPTLRNRYRVTKANLDDYMKVLKRNVFNYPIVLNYPSSKTD